GAAVFSPNLTAPPKLQAVAASGAGQIDLNNNDLIVGPGTTKSSVESLVASARSGGSWLGPGLTSSTARTSPQHNTTLGVLSGSEFASMNSGTTLFAGRSFSPADT